VKQHNSELIVLKCRCGNERSSLNSGGEVDIADFLRDAIGAGWKRIDEEQVNLIPSEHAAEIYLKGQCENCMAVERAAKKVA
jgi:hypothetical protein